MPKDKTGAVEWGAQLCRQLEDKDQLLCKQ